MSKTSSITCFGEVLWDMLPGGKVAGGAPMNVAFHAQSFGTKAQMISAVGNDDLGKELLEFLNEKGIATELVSINQNYPTSTVQVTLNQSGSASYEIVAPVAWDFIETNKASEKAVEAADLLLFGSLICRNSQNIHTLYKLIDKAKKTVFDVNLRPPFYNQSLIEDLLHKANIVKMNEDELQIVVDWLGISKDLEQQITFVMQKYDIETLLLTEGSKGAYCMNQNQLYFQKSFPITVRDTVGAGDSFLASFLCKMLAGKNWQECLKFAAATGALVATKSGGTPELNEKMVLEFMTK